MAKHYIAMAGVHGCMPSACASFSNRTQAAVYLHGVHGYDWSKRKFHTLRKDGYIELDMAMDGNEYAEIVYCDCDNPSVHNDD